MQTDYDLVYIKTVHLINDCRMFLVAIHPNQEVFQHAIEQCSIHIKNIDGMFSHGSDDYIKLCTQLITKNRMSAKFCH